MLMRKPLNSEPDMLATRSLRGVRFREEGKGDRGDEDSLRPTRCLCIEKLEYNERENINVDVATKRAERLRAAEDFQGCS